MTLLKFFWGINALASLVILYYFVIGLADGSVTYRNIKLWLLILIAVGAILWVSTLLKNAGYNKAAILLTLVLALPSIVYGLFILIAIFSKSRWN
jgi:ABC-type phosphate transport system permease subunit